MIATMSLRLIAAVLAGCALACSSGSMSVKKGEPQTAREKMLAEQKQRGDDEASPSGGKRWAGWRYQGERSDCFFQVGRRCFKTAQAACTAARCKAPATCQTAGAGPAQVSCSGAGNKPAGGSDATND